MDGGFSGAIKLMQIAQAIGDIPVKSIDIITFIILSKTIVI